MQIIILIMRNIDLLKAMRTFRTVVEQQSFSEAARKLNLATSAVSRQVTDLEQRFGCKLLQRTTRSMTLTDEGRDYLAGIDDILDRVAQLEEEITERRNVIAGRLRITSSLHSRALGLQPLLGRFLQQHPDVQLSWMIVNRYVNLVEEGFDLAIRVGELPDSGLVAREIGTIRIFFVASPDYLKRNGEPRTPKQLASHRCVLDGTTHQPARWRYKGEKGTRHVTVDDSIDVSDGELVADFATRGLGIACLPEFLVANQLASGELVQVLRRYEATPVPLSIVYPANRVMKPAQRALIDFLVANRHEASTYQRKTERPME